MLTNSKIETTSKTKTSSESHSTGTTTRQQPQKQQQQQERQQQKQNQEKEQQQRQEPQFKDVLNIFKGHGLNVHKRPSANLQNREQLQAHTAAAERAAEQSVNRGGPIKLFLAPPYGQFGVP